MGTQHAGIRGINGAYKGDCKKHGETDSQQVWETYHICFINEYVGKVLYIQALKWIVAIHGIDQFLFLICASSHSKVLAFFFRVMHEERKMVAGNMQLQTAI